MIGKDNLKRGGGGAGSNEIVSREILKTTATGLWTGNYYATDNYNGTYYSLGSNTLIYKYEFGNANYVGLSFRKNGSSYSLTTSGHDFKLHVLNSTTIVLLDYNNATNNSRSVNVMTIDISNGIADILHEYSYNPISSSDGYSYYFKSMIDRTTGDLIVWLCSTQEWRDFLSVVHCENNTTTLKKTPTIFTHDTGYYRVPQKLDTIGNHRFVITNTCVNKNSTSYHRNEVIAIDTTNANYSYSRQIDTTDNANAFEYFICCKDTNSLAVCMYIINSSGHWFKITRCNYINSSTNTTTQLLSPTQIFNTSMGQDNWGIRSGVVFEKEQGKLVALANDNNNQNKYHYIQFTIGDNTYTEDACITDYGGPYMDYNITAICYNGVFACIKSGYDILEVYYNNGALKTKYGVYGDSYALNSSCIKGFWTSINNIYLVDKEIHTFNSTKLSVNGSGTATLINGTTVSTQSFSSSLTTDENGVVKIDGTTKTGYLEKYFTT